MERKSIFQRIEETYNIDDELRKINNLFENEKYFFKFYNYYGQKTVDKNFTFVDMLENYMFDKWKHRGTCISIKELLIRANAQFSSHPSFKIEEETAINFIEVIINLIKLYRDNKSALSNSCVDNYSDFSDVFCPLVEALKKHLGLAERIIDGAIVLYPENAPLEQVINLVNESDVQWELIHYTREKMSLSDKRKALAFLATNLYIEQDSKETDIHIKDLISKSTNILNNLHIRHNNKTGKWTNAVLDNIDEHNACKLCDMVFNLMLTIVLLREQKKYEPIYDSFNNMQKQSKKEI